MKDWVSQSQNKDLGRSTGFPELFNTITKAETDTLLWHFINFFQISVLLLKWKRCLYRVILVSSVQLSRSVMSDSLRPHGLQHTRPPCPSPTPKSNSPEIYTTKRKKPINTEITISSSVVPFSSRCQSFPASGSFQMSQLFATGGQSIGVSALTSVLPVNTQDWSSLGWTGLISLQSKELSRVSSNTTVQKHQFFSVHLSLWSSSHIHTWLLEKT